MKKTFYITTTLPYVNAEPHIGFALEIVAADVIARYKKIQGYQVVFNTGTDEHGQKIFLKAQENNQNPQEYVDFWAEKFSDLKSLLNINYTNFIRTTNPEHKKAAQEFWKRCKDNGDIYKKNYKTSYCIGCEMEKQASDLEDGYCPLHPNKELEIREEENYFFKFSKYQQDLLNLYESNPNFVKPESKLKEITAFVSGGLQDFSISRLKEKMSWGVPVPGDEDHVMYVWFDALVSYISTLGWPNEVVNDKPTEFNNFWPGIQLAGKDNLRQQSAMWQAMLMSAGITNSEQILINGFISVDGQKMSKSLGNVISPTEIVNKYGIEGSRFLLMFIGPFGNDMDVSWDKFNTIYTAHLSNGVGNLCSRVAKMCEKNGLGFNTNNKKIETSVEYQKFMKSFQLKEALDLTFDFVSQSDQYLSEETPWKKDGQEQQEILQIAVNSILKIAKQLKPFMPETSQTIQEHFSQENISALKPLFPRLEK
jgi:methionyl-tRNA synthetase